MNFDLDGFYVFGEVFVWGEYWDYVVCDWGECLWFDWVVVGFVFDCFVCVLCLGDFCFDFDFVIDFDFG